MLDPCKICGRTFNADRLKKHEIVCRRQKKKKVKVKRFNKRITAKEKMRMNKKKQGKMPKWKVQHMEFMKAMKYMKKVKQVEERGGNILDLAPPPPAENPDFIPCKHCGRKLREQAHPRHEKICLKVFGGKKKGGKPVRGPARPARSNATRGGRRRRY